MSQAQEVAPELLAQAVDEAGQGDAEVLRRQMGRVTPPQYLIAAQRYLSVSSVADGGREAGSRRFTKTAFERSARLLV